MSSAPRSSPSAPPGRPAHGPRRPLPLARVARPRIGGGVRLEPIPLSAQLRAALRRICRGSLDLTRAALGACVAIVDRSLSSARHGAERLLWRLGYAEVELVEQATATALAPPPRATRPRLTAARRPAREGDIDYEDEAVTAVYPHDPLDNAETNVVLSRPATEDEVTRVAGGADVISLADHRARR